MMTDPPTDDTEAREPDAPDDPTDAKHHAPLHGHTGGVPSDKALSDMVLAVGIAWVLGVGCWYCVGVGCWLSFIVVSRVSVPICCCFLLCALCACAAARVREGGRAGAGQTYSSKMSRV
eukprot:scaffold1074_cov83-Isochrysis_galbana.AAC.1